MQSGFYSATGGMVTQFNRLDTLSNNLANLNTNGFKRDDVVIGDFMRLYQEERDKLPLRNHTKSASQFLNRSMDRVPQIVESYTDRKLGGMQRTENKLDFALQRKELFFAIETPQGVRYTRDGGFVLDGNGLLVTKEGFPVLSSDGIDNSAHIEIPEGKDITVDKDGNFYADQEEFEKIAVVQFNNIKYIQKEGGNLYRNLEYENRQTLENTGAVMQGYIEKSNVNAVMEMTGLIETNRLVDMYQKVMTTHMDDLNNDAINKLARLKA